MNKSLLHFYEDELQALKQSGKRFAAEHPNIAGRLGFKCNEIDDPHIERLIQSAAFLNARTQKQLRDNIPQTVTALLHALYPYYEKPIPSMGIVQFSIDPDADNLVKIPRHATLAMGSDSEHPCLFTTCYPATVWPIAVQNATLDTQSPLPQLEITLRYTNNGLSFEEICPNTLRFFLQGTHKVTQALYGTLFQEVTKIALCNEREIITTLEHSNIRQVGFDDREAVLPSAAHYNREPYRILTEYFVFPEKFLFFDIANIDQNNLKNAHNTLKIIFYLKKIPHVLKHKINASNFLLGCAPVVNFFKQTAEPITINAEQTDYPLLPSVKHSIDTEQIYNIERVTALSPYNDQIEYHHFYGLTHNNQTDKNYWHDYQKDDVTYIALTHDTAKHKMNDDWTIHAETTCINGDMPRKLFFEQNMTTLQMKNGSNACAHIHWVSAPTASLPAPIHAENTWQLVSHLTANHASLTTKDASVLKELLAIYDFAHNTNTQLLIHAMMHIQTKRVHKCLPNDPVNLLCQGLEITIDLNINNGINDEIILFGSVLDCFLTIYCAFNNFTQLVFTADHFQKELHRWPPRFGIKNIL